MTTQPPTQGRINSRLYWIGGQIATCDTKVPFHRMRDALACADKIASIHGKRQSPYRCPVCNEWHLTKDRAGERK